jgi:hypothetical protein
MGLALNYIDQSLVSYQPGTPTFFQDYSDNMGDAGTDADGFDADLAAVMALLPDGDTMLDDLDSTTSDLLTALDDGASISADGIVSGWADGLPAINMLAANVTLQTVGSLSLPAVSLPTGTTTPTTPQTTCQPIQQPSSGTGGTGTTGTTTCEQTPCPTGYVSTGQGTCELAEQPSEPVIIPPIGEPGGGTICPPGYAPTATGDCYPSTPTTPPPIILPTGPDTGACDPLDPANECPPDDGETPPGCYLWVYVSDPLEDTEIPECF